MPTTAPPLQKASDSHQLDRLVAVWALPTSGTVKNARVRSTSFQWSKSSNF